jgi:transposase-like protein
MADSDLKLLREEIALLGPRRPSRRYPPTLKERILGWARGRLAAGEHHSEVALALEIPWESLRKWMQAGESGTAATPGQGGPGTLRPVRVVAKVERARGPGLILRSPRGYAIEGLDLLAVVELLARLG